jgi:hypothetical protein
MQTIEGLPLPHIPIPLHPLAAPKPVEAKAGQLSPFAFHSFKDQARERHTY